MRDRPGITYTGALAISIAGGSDYQSLALAHSQILGVLSREVAEAIKNNPYLLLAILIVLHVRHLAVPTSEWRVSPPPHEALIGECTLGSRYWVPPIAILIVPEIQNSIIMDAGYLYSFLRNNPG